MRVLMIANHYPVCSARYATDAFARLGHDVTHIGESMGRSVWGLDLPPSLAWEPEEQPVDPPELIVVMDSDPNVLNAAEAYKASATCPVIVWGVDNHVREYRRPWFDHYFLAHKAVSLMPYQSDTTWTPCSYDPGLHTPSEIPFANRAYDVAMLGVMYSQRWEAVNALKEAGLSVMAGSGVIGESYRDIHHNARVSVVVSAAGDVALRVFESAAMGCAVVADRCKDFDALSFPRDYQYNRGDWNGMVIAVKAALENPAYAQQCVNWAKPHTWDARARQIALWAKGQAVAA